MAVITTADAARRLGVHPSRVRRLAERYKIGQKTGSGYLYFTQADLRKLESRSTGKAGRPKAVE